MDASIHAHLISQHIQDRIGEAQAARTARAVERRPAALPKLRLRLRRRSVIIPSA